MDVAIIMEAMIIKYIQSEVKQNKFVERINMREYCDEMEKILYEEFGEELYKKDAIIEQKDSEIEIQKQEINSQKLKLQEYKTKIKQLNSIKDKSSPEALKILNSLLLI